MSVHFVSWRRWEIQLQLVYSFTWFSWSVARSTVICPFILLSLQQLHNNIFDIEFATTSGDDRPSRWLRTERKNHSLTWMRRSRRRTSSELRLLMSAFKRRLSPLTYADRSSWTLSDSGPFLQHRQQEIRFLRRLSGFCKFKNDILVIFKVGKKR